MRSVVWASILSVMIAAGAAPAASQSTVDDGRRESAKGNAIGALHIWRPLAEKGGAEAQFLMGWALEYGQGIAADPKEAMRWYRRAADQGDARAQSNIGLMYDVGLGVPQDQREAARWYAMAAENGNAAAQFNLGWLHQNGTGVAQDFEKAAALYAKAAEQGNAAAWYNLGLLYEDGTGVPKDPVRAHMWFNLAGSGLPPEQASLAVRSREALAATMTSEQVRLALGMAQSCTKAEFKAC